MVVIEKMRIGVDVVDGAAINADGSKNARVIGNAGEIGTDSTIFEKDGTACVATLDTAIEIVPLVHPSDSGIGLLRFVEVLQRLAARDFAEKRKSPIEDATIFLGSDDE